FEPNSIIAYRLAKQSCQKNKIRKVYGTVFI
ncbi:MAG: hypothetical protein ACI8V2_004909, partial [Candidatus Latescibacterota bacterium]